MIYRIFSISEGGRYLEHLDWSLDVEAGDTECLNWNWHVDIPHKKRSCAPFFTTEFTMGQEIASRPKKDPDPHEYRQGQRERERRALSGTEVGAVSVLT